MIGDVHIQDGHSEEDHGMRSLGRYPATVDNLGFTCGETFTGYFQPDPGDDQTGENVCVPAFGDERKAHCREVFDLA